MNASIIEMTAVIIVYLMFMVIIGIWASRRNNDTGDFYLGGRRMGPLVTAMSAEASDMSSYLFMGIPGLAYLTGCSDAVWTAIGLCAGTYLNWLLVAKRIRKYTEVSKNSITIPEFFSNRFGDGRNMLRAIAAAVIIIFFIPYTASGFAACGKLFNSLFGADYKIAMIISAAVIIAYTIMGGFLAASMTDLAQGIIMSFALIAIFIIGVNFAGGFDRVAENANKMVGYMDLFENYSPDTGSSKPYSFLSVVSILAWGLGYCGMPHILLRFMAIRDSSKLKTSRRIATVWVVIAMAVAIGVGIVGRSVSLAGHIPVLEGSASETVLIKLAELVAKYGIIGAIIGGLAVSGVLAATMSTSSSQLLAAASSISQDLFKGFFGLNVSRKAEMHIARLSLLFVSIFGVVIARNPESSVFQIVSFAWAGFGAAFGPVVISALFWKRANKWGALAGMISGGAMVFIWKFLVRPLGGGWDLYELLPAFIVALAAIVIVSLLTGKPDQEVLDEFDEYKRAMQAD